jgi:hypothetical protein
MQTVIFTHPANLIFDIPNLLKTMGADTSACAAAMLEVISNPSNWAKNGHSHNFGGILVKREGGVIKAQYLN